MEEAKVELKQELEGLSEAEKNEKIKKSVQAQIKRIGHAKNDALVAKYIDKVELGKEGYKFRYYSEKFHVHT